MPHFVWLKCHCVAAAQFPASVSPSNDHYNRFSVIFHLQWYYSTKYASRCHRTLATCQTMDQARTPIAANNSRTFYANRDVYAWCDDDAGFEFDVACTWHSHDRPIFDCICRRRCGSSDRWAACGWASSLWLSSPIPWPALFRYSDCICPRPSESLCRHSIGPFWRNSLDCSCAHCNYHHVDLWIGNWTIAVFGESTLRINKYGNVSYAQHVLVRVCGVSGTHEWWIYWQLRWLWRAWHRSAVIRRSSGMFDRHWQRCELLACHTQVQFRCEHTTEHWFVYLAVFKWMHNSKCNGILTTLVWAYNSIGMHVATTHC